MKSVTQIARSLRGVLALAATLLIVPLTSGLNPAEAKPPRHAPAYGYRDKRRGPGYDRRRPVRREYRRTPRRSYRNDWRTNRRNNDWRKYNRRDNDNRRYTDWRNRR